MYKRVIMIVVVLGAVAAVALSLSTSNAAEEKTSQSLIKRGEYLVNGGGCNDCHTPWVMTDKGPQPDMTRMLSGHPADAKVPEVPKDLFGPDRWGGVMSPDMTSWGGPWGVSFTANLTPDQVTGLGAWTPEVFIKAMRTGKHMGSGRDILPPMPWYDLAKLSDTDLRAIFAYLQSLKPIQNQVPLPMAPEAR